MMIFNFDNKIIIVPDCMLKIDVYLKKMNAVPAALKTQMMDQRINSVTMFSVNSLILHLCS